MVLCTKSSGSACPVMQGFFMGGVLWVGLDDGGKAYGLETSLYEVCKYLKSVFRHTPKPLCFAWIE